MPGDKSISHRAALLASIASGASRIRWFASSADCQATLDCIARLGIVVKRDGQDVVVEGRGLRGYRASQVPARLWAANSGSTIRMIAGLLAGSPVESEIDGDSSLRRRPMRRIIEPLRLMGAEIHGREENYPPLRIRGRALRPIHYDSPVPSAQIKTCVLMAGLLADGTTAVTEPAASRNHTELMLPEFGSPITLRARGPGQEVTVEGGRALTPVDYRVPGDVSSAAFLVAGAVLAPGSNLTILGAGLNPTRTGFLAVLDQLGANTGRINIREAAGEPVGDIVVRSTALSSSGAALLSGPVIANIIDEIPVLAVVGTQVAGRLEVRGARELRIKESDRIKAVVEGIRAMNGQIEEFDDGFAIEGPQRLVGGRVDSRGDHRIAMAFAVAGLIAEGVTEINDAGCAAVSFPEFYSTLAGLTPEGTVLEG